MSEQIAYRDESIKRTARPCGIRNLKLARKPNTEKLPRITIESDPDQHLRACMIAKTYAAEFNSTYRGIPRTDPRDGIVIRVGEKFSPDAIVFLVWGSDRKTFVRQVKG